MKFVTFLLLAVCASKVYGNDPLQEYKQALKARDEACQRVYDTMSQGRRMIALQKMILIAAYDQAPAEAKQCAELLKEIEDCCNGLENEVRVGQMTNRIPDVQAGLSRLQLLQAQYELAIGLLNSALHK